MGFDFNELLLKSMNDFKDRWDSIRSIFSSHGDSGTSRVLQGLKDTLAEPKQSVRTLCSASISLKCLHLLLQQNTDATNKKESLESDFSLNNSQADDRVFPLDLNMLLLAEKVFQEDLRDVRIHTGSNSHNLARSMGAEAFTKGSDIYFQDGKYRPDTEEGNALLVHELQHTIQHKNGADNRYQEDLENLEYEASKVESVLGGKNLSESEGTDSEALPENRSSLSTEDFGKKVESMLKVITKDGRQFVIKATEREEVLERAQRIFEEKLEEQWLFMSEDEKQYVLEKLYSGGSTL